MVSVLLSLLGQAQTDRRKADNSREMVSLLNTAMLAHEERMEMLYLARGTGSITAAEKAHALASKAANDVETVRKLAHENPEEGTVFIQVADLITSLIDSVKALNNQSDAGDKTRALRDLMQLQSRFDYVTNLADGFFLKQNKLQRANQASLEAKEKAITAALYASMLLSVLTAFGLTLFFNRSTSDRLQIIMDNTNRIAAGKPPLCLLSGDDELTRIDRMYHQMYKDLVSLREKERALLDNAAELICSIDINLRLSDVNLSAEKILGFSQQQLIGLRVLDLIEGQQQESAGGALEAAFDKDEPSHLDAKMKRADGTIIDTEWVTTAAANRDSIYCVILDVTQRKLVAQMRREFVAMVSHDLRTPLSSIQMILALTQEEAEARQGLSQEGLDGLATAQNSANRLMALVNNLLDLEKLESGQFELVARVKPLQYLLKEALGSVDILARQKKISLKLEGDQDIEAYFDDERVIQVVINLVSNAIKFSPKGSTITVTVQSSKDFVRLAISDQGRGIPPEMCSQIFERFRQVSADDQYQMKGAGLGLAICKAIVERHMGTIGVESPVGQGQGSTFWFTLPASKDLFVRLEQEAKTRSIG
jgi:PAS domain S-box-containing protein